jgi:hypothetical protein
LIAEKRAKETGDSPAKRLEITAAMCFNFALVQMGQHQLALGHSTRQLPRKDRGACKFRALTPEKMAKETGDSPTKRLEITAAMCFNFALVRLGQHQLALGHSTRQLPRTNRRA